MSLLAGSQGCRGLVGGRCAVSGLRLLRVCRLSIWVVEGLCRGRLGIGVVVTVWLGRRYLLHLWLGNGLLLVVVLDAYGWLLGVLLHCRRRSWRALCGLRDVVVGLVLLLALEDNPDGDDYGD